LIDSANRPALNYGGMSRTLNLVAVAVYVGFFHGLAVALLVAYWEDKRPILGMTTPEQEQKFNAHMRRTWLCAGVLTAVLYMVLTYWWPRWPT
jgi:H+/Cl- antiporter ClcA